MIPFLMMLPMLVPAGVKRGRSSKAGREGGLSPVPSPTKDSGRAPPVRAASRRRRLPAQVLGQRALNRALLQRQWLLQRSQAGVMEALEHLVGLQAQATHPPYGALWTRLNGFQQEALTRLVTERQVVRAGMMRGTLHLVTARDCLALRPVLQPALDRGLKHSSHAKQLAGVEVQALVAEGRALLEARPSPRGELGQRLQAKWPGHDASALSQGFSCLEPLVTVPPSGTWGHGERMVYATAESWLGQRFEPAAPPDALVMRYLAAFGPASAKDLQAWSGLPRMGAVLERLRPELRAFRDEHGVELFDIPNARRPDPDTPAPVRFLSEFDSVLLAHADRTRIISDAARKRVFTLNGIVRATLLVDGFVRGTWRIERARGTATLCITPFARLSREDRAALSDEGGRLLAFAAADDQHADIRFERMG
ncbi:winged helix DNA-binding domain-containing protein [Myxococcus sp. AB056]|uniref:winged helix DNA-binding domain-containing protein n=1 Tax=Myxococcus sp. AB056 TaxID=2562792 RepID=UPI001E323659|nr:winged helix DNA-binding domain-containing protein [Myxococcus sp. AB056]